MPQNPLELRLTRLGCPTLKALAAMNCMGIPSLGPHLELMLHASRTEYPLVNHIVGRQHGSVEDGPARAELRLH